MPDLHRKGSITKRINLSSVWHSLWTMLFFDLLFIVIAVLFWCYAVEINAMGSGWSLKLTRYFTAGNSGNWFEKLGTVKYIFEIDEDLIIVPAGVFFQTLTRGLIGVATVQLVVLIKRIFTGEKHYRKILSPVIEEVSQTAEELSQVAFDEQKFHNLESAIAAISPNAPEARLHTGDKELQGLETAVNNLLTRLHESYRQQTRFVSDVSHELRTPISVIQGYADMLARWGASDEKVLEESILAIRSEAKNMQHMVEQLLFLARGDAGRNHVNPQEIDLSSLVKEVCDEYAMINRTHSFTVQEEDNVRAFGDVELIKQVMRILTDNAVKYSADGSPIVLRAFFNYDNEPCFSVQDNGVGMAGEDIPHIFDRFYRSDPARTRNTGGTGLGLSIARWIVEKHQGYFNVISREGVGTRIEVVLPEFEKASRLLADMSVLPQEKQTKEEYSTESSAEKQYTQKELIEE